MIELVGGGQLSWLKWLKWLSYSQSLQSVFKVCCSAKHDWLAVKILMSNEVSEMKSDGKWTSALTIFHVSSVLTCTCIWMDNKTIHKFTVVSKDGWILLRNIWNTEIKPKYMCILPRHWTWSGNQKAKRRTHFSFQDELVTYTNTVWLAWLNWLKQNRKVNWSDWINVSDLDALNQLKQALRFADAPPSIQTTSS